VLADVRERHTLCLEAVHVKIVCVIAPSKDAIASFVGRKAASAVALGELLKGYRQSLVALVHPKFAFVACINDAGVCERFEIPKGGRLHRSSAVAELYAQTAVLVRQLIDSKKLLDKDVSELVRTDPLARKSGFVVRPWGSRHEMTADAETTKLLEAADFARRRSKGGKSKVSPPYNIKQEHHFIGLQWRHHRLRQPLPPHPDTDAAAAAGTALASAAAPSRRRGRRAGRPA
jgi:hypothetical protein